MYLERKRRAAFAHDLIELAEELGAPQNAVRAAAELSPDYHIVAGVAKGKRLVWIRA